MDDIFVKLMIVVMVFASSHQALGAVSTSPSKDSSLPYMICLQFPGAACSPVTYERQAP